MFFFKGVPKKVYLLGLFLSLIPVAIMGAAWLTTPADHVFNWEIQYDQFYYASNAREMFDNGNGFAYPNPFDCRDDSPAIYSHLFPLLIGHLWKTTGRPIMSVFIPIRILFGLLFTIAVWHLASLLFPNMRISAIVFYCLMICGGGISTGLGVMAVASGKAPISQFFHNLAFIEGMAGWWFLNLFRNFFYATEILYHFIFFATLLLVLKKRWMWSLLFLAMMLYAHPYTGFQLGLVYTGYFFLSYLVEQHEKKKYFLMGLCGSILLLIFIGYNVLWLRKFPQHRELMNELMGVEYAVLGIRKLIICWGIWLPFGLYGAVRYFKPLIASREWRLVLSLLVVSFALVNHHYIMPVRVQPAHFSHGYVFTPLVLITFYVFGKAIQRGNRAAMLLQAPLLIGAFIFVTALDNVCYVPRMYAMAQIPPATITAAENNVIQFLSAQRQRHVVATTNESIGYLLTAFTEHDAVVGYIHHTPQSELKKKMLLDLLRNGDESLLHIYKNIDVLVLSPSEKDEISRYIFFKKWKELFHNEEFFVYAVRR